MNETREESHDFNRVECQIAVDESVYGCPYVSACGIKNLLSKSGIGLWLVDMKNRLRQRED
jgi:hypothetical protein